MKKRSSRYSFFQIITAILMIKALLCFTLSTPVMYKWELKEKAADIALSQPDEEKEEIDYIPSPMSGTAEEKTETNQSGFSEYLHDPDEIETRSEALLCYNKCIAGTEYIAFHGELLSPPPKA